jgi:hypothetical protein
MYCVAHLTITRWYKCFIVSGSSMPAIPCVSSLVTNATWGHPQAPYNMILYTDQILVPSGVSISTESSKLYQIDVKSGSRCDYSSRA